MTCNRKFCARDAAHGLSSARAHHRDGAGRELSYAIAATTNSPARTRRRRPHFRGNPCYNPPSGTEKTPGSGFPTGFRTGCALRREFDIPTPRYTFRKRSQRSFLIQTWGATLVVASFVECVKAKLLVETLCPNLRQKLNAMLAVLKRALLARADKRLAYALSPSSLEHCEPAKHITAPRCREEQPAGPYRRAFFGGNEVQRRGVNLVKLVLEALLLHEDSRTDESRLLWKRAIRANIQVRHPAQSYRALAL